jgi:hypothetical protein
LDVIRAYYKNPRGDFEDTVGSLRHLIETQGLILSDRTGHQIAHHASMEISHKLYAAYGSVFRCQTKMHWVFAAFLTAKNESLKLRRAA